MSAEPRLSIRCHYDFASTLCYVAHRVLGRLSGPLDELGIDVIWSPIDLARLTGWQRGAPVAPDRLANARRVARDLGVEVRVPGVWLDCRPAMALALVISDASREASWRERVFSWIFEQGGEVGVFERLARNLDIDWHEDEIEHHLGELDDLTLRASEEMVTGVPTFMLGSWPLGGIQDDHTLLTIFDRFARRQRASCADTAS